MQGRKTCQVLLLLFACLWLVSCSSPATPTQTPEEIPVEAPPAETQQVAQQPDSTPTPASPCAATSPSAGAVVTIGAILPLSSPGALLAGFAMQTALNIAVTDINERGGIREKPIRLITYDSAGKPERAAQFAERLILLDCAVSIVGLYHNSEAMAVTDVAHRYGIPVIVAAAGADDITARGYPEVFRIAPAYSTIAQFPTSWLQEIGDYNHDGTVSAAIIADNTIGAPLLVEALRDNLIDAGFGAELLRVDLPSTDFSPVIARLVAHKQLPDVIFITIKGESALQLQAQLLDAGIGPQRATMIVQSHAGIDSDQFWHAVPNGTGTVVAHMGAWATTVTEQGQDFAIKYDQYMGHWPEPYAFAAYDSICLVANALRDAPSWTSSDLIATLEQAQSAMTNGEISFAYTSLDVSNTTQPDYLWHQWQDSQILYLQYTEPNQPATAMPIIWPPHHRTLR